MTPPETAAQPRTARPANRRPAAKRPPRRVSGPARGARAVAGPPRAGAVAVPPPLGLRLARTARRIPDARFLDRLLRGRTWIAVVAVSLMGIVFIQVSMLRLNAGISRAITSGETLSRQNSAMRAEISKLDSGDRIADAAQSLGMIEPPAGKVNYLDARKANGREAARNIHPPKPAKDAASTTGTAAGTAAPAATAAPVAAAATQQPTAAPQATTTTQGQAATAPTTTTAPPTQTQTQAPVTMTAPATTTPAQPTSTAPTQTAPPTQTTPAPTQTAAAGTVTPAGGTTVTGQGGQ
jgi:cell division protein FtsL